MSVLFFHQNSKERGLTVTNTDIDETFISPYSLYQYEWKLEWQTVSFDKKSLVPNENRSKKQERAIEAISTIGVIDSKHLESVFQIGKEKAKKMCARHLLERHSLYKGDLKIPIYTVGKYGGNKIMPEFDNYWLDMTITDVLKALTFFDFYYLLGEQEILSAPKPFTGAIRIKDALFYVYINRDGIKDLTTFLKWKRDFQERIFVVTESLDSLQELNMFLETSTIKMRVILDKQLNQKKFELYHFDANHINKWIKG